MEVEAGIGGEEEVGEQVGLKKDLRFLDF